MRFALSLCAALTLTGAAGAQDPKGAAFPRRLLFVQVADYLYLNPLTPAPREAVTKLAAGLRVPAARDNDQLFVLSDAVADSPLPTKEVLAKVLDGFCTTTRAQDRVVLYFGAHAVEKDGKAFVVPIDGDPADPAGLLPVADVYSKLKNLKASQTVVIWDVCRHNPERVRGRRDPGPMTPELFKALTAAPEGVQVLVSCSPGERAAELFAPRGATALPGSVYLDALRQATADDRAANPKAAPGGPIPVESLHMAAVKAVAAVTKTQTPALAGKPVAPPAEYDPKEAAAKRFELPAAPKPLPEAKAIFDELALPPFADGGAAPARLPFAATALKDYAADVSADEVLKNAEKYPLRAATLRALQGVRTHWPLGGKEQAAVAALTAPVTDRTKQAVTKAQEAVAVALIGLELELERLEGVADRRDKETKRWRANHDLALAEVRLRVVVLNEYSRALGRVKTEALPDLPAGATGWRLVPSARIEGKRDVRALLAAADEGFATLAAEHKGTPWEVLARREKFTALGLEWKPN